MEGKTHYIGGSIGVIAGFILLKENGALLDNVSPIIQFSIMYPFGIYGGMLPDADHHPESSPLKDPIGRVFNRVLHIFNSPYKRLDELYSEDHKRKSLVYKLLKVLKCTHRSWQTHSELTLAFMLYVLYSLSKVNASSIDATFTLLMVTGLTIGIISHLILDMLTSEGINFAIGFILKVFFPRLPIFQTIRLVPNWHTFTTGSPYELTIRSVLNVLQFFVLGYAILVIMGYTLVLT